MIGADPGSTVPGLPLPGLTVRGGVGGTAARVADLLGCADLLLQAAGTVRDRAGLVLAVQTGPVAVSVLRSPGTGLAAETALVRCLAGPHGLLAESGRLAALGTAQRRVAALYLAADRSAADLVRAAATGLLGPAADPVLLAGVASTGAALLHPVPAPVVTPDGDWRRSRPAGGLAGLAAAIDPPPGPAAGEGPRPQIRVQRVTDAGATRWVVTVGGTRDWSPIPGAEPFDLSGDLELLGGAVRPSAGPAAPTAAVVAAMTAAGVRPGQPVLIAGHSQGGMAAAAIVADPLLRDRFTVTHLVALGSPVSRVPVPAGVQVMTVEHVDDPVPLADAGADPDRPTWVAVRARSPGPEPGPEVGPGLGPELGIPLSTAAHRLDRYRLTAAAVDRSDDPSVAAWRASAAAFLAPGPGAVLDERAFTARRPGFG